MTLEELVETIRRKKSFLCVGLDTDLEKIPKHLLELDDPLFEFNRAIIEATHDLCIAYKPNTAFYEAYGSDGFKSLEKTIAYLNSHHPEHFTIADAKRGDIGNTAHRYAEAFFQRMNFDSITVAPYMGRDSIEPFLSYEGKFCILLGHTSNGGSEDFQTLHTKDGKLYESVLKTSKGYANKERLMYVIGATKASALAEIRKIIPDNFLLVPGVGAQGGSLAEVCKYGMNDKVGLLVNSSRGIIYASADKDFAEAARAKAMEVQQEMAAYL